MIHSKMNIKLKVKLFFGGGGFRIISNFGHKVGLH